MGVVTKYGKSVKDPASVNLADPTFAEGRVRVILTGPIAVANGDSIASKHYLGKIPSNAILMVDSNVVTTAITGLTIYAIKAEYNGAAVGSTIATLDLATAGVKGILAAAAAGAVGRRLWEVLGLTKDPAVEYDIVGEFGAAAGANGTLEACLYIAKK